MSIATIFQFFFKKKRHLFRMSFIFYGAGDGMLLRLRYAILSSFVYEPRPNPKHHNNKRKRIRFGILFLLELVTGFGRLLTFFLDGQALRSESGEDCDLRRFANRQRFAKKKRHLFRMSFLFYGAGDGIRTCDLLITNQLLYRLSHTSVNLFNFYILFYNFFTLIF